jgi:hypothetical protein
MCGRNKIETRQSGARIYLRTTFIASTPDGRNSFAPEYTYSLRQVAISPVSATMLASLITSTKTIPRYAPSPRYLNIL